MPKTKALGFTAAVAALALGLTACGGGGESGEGGEGGGDALQFGYIFPESGDLSFLGPPQITAAEYAIQEINDAGGVLGTQLPELVGGDDSPGVRQGGVLELVTHQVDIEALPTDIPETIPVDVSGMEINDTLTLADVTPPEGVTFVTAEGVELSDITIATITPPRVTAAAEPEVEEETELVGEEAEGEAESGDEGEAEASE